MPSDFLLSIVAADDASTPCLPRFGLPHQSDVPLLKHVLPPLGYQPLLSQLSRYPA